MMKPLVFAALFVATSGLCGTSVNGVATRVALVSTGGGEAGKDVLMLADLRQRIESTWPELVRATSAVPWREARPLVRRADLGDVGGLVAAVIYDGKLLVTGIHGDGQVQAFCVPLPGGPIRSLGKLSTSIRQSTGIRRSTGARFHDQVVEPVGAVCAGGGCYFVSGRDDGSVVAFPVSGRPPQCIDEAAKLPSNQVRALAWLDGKLYAALGDGGYLVRLDPRGGPCEVLASSRGKEKLSPLDDIPQFRIDYLAADPQRRRLLFTIRFSDHDAEHKRDHGLWQYDLATTTFKQVLKVGRASMQAIGWPGAIGGTGVCNDEITLWFYFSSVRMDLKTDKPLLLYTQAGFNDIPGLEVRNAPYRSFIGSEPPYAEMDGWLWAVRGTFARMSKEKGIIERLPSLDTAEPHTSYWYLQALDGSHLMVGDDSAIWLLTLKPTLQP